MICDSCSDNPMQKRSPKRTGRQCSPCTYNTSIYSPEVLSRPTPGLREDVYSPTAGFSYRANRGYRPRDYFTRMTSLGGDANPTGLAGVSARTNASDGFVWRPPQPCSCVPEISTCSRFGSSQYNKTQEKPPACSRNDRKQDNPNSSSEEEDEDDDEEEEESEEEPTPPCLCMCTNEVETKAVTSDAFTMTEVNMREQGTMVELHYSNKLVDATIVMRDVTTDTDDKFPDPPEQIQSTKKDPSQSSIQLRGNKKTVF
ncbi:hypothetical protein EGW08_005667 [Elysia chlorotica]|uniref:Uncharacterized protein n=1 Tax=Elysia chlorotica TaxID=188477 RepID=A0A3S1BEM3_ELYCH|nr:hypothetical protein EGW08_005667 [Elysia chlorotica]